MQVFVEGERGTGKSAIIGSTVGMMMDLSVVNNVLITGCSDIGALTAATYLLRQRQGEVRAFVPGITDSDYVFDLVSMAGPPIPTNRFDRDVPYMAVVSNRDLQRDEIRNVDFDVVVVGDASSMLTPFLRALRLQFPSKLAIFEMRQSQVHDTIDRVRDHCCVKKNFAVCVFVIFFAHQHRNAFAGRKEPSVHPITQMECMSTPDKCVRVFTCNVSFFTRIVSFFES